MNRWKICQLVCVFAILSLVASVTGCSGFTVFGKKVYGIAPKLHNGETVTIGTDIDLVRIALEDGYDWEGSFSDPTMLKLESKGPVYGKDGFEAIVWVYQVAHSGRTSLRVTGEPKCRKDATPCSTPSVVYQVEIVVR